MLLSFFNFDHPLLIYSLFNNCLLTSENKIASPDHLFFIIFSSILLIFIRLQEKYNNIIAWLNIRNIIDFLICAQSYSLKGLDHFCSLPFLSNFNVKFLNPHISSPFEYFPTLSGFPRSFFILIFFHLFSDYPIFDPTHYS